MLEQSAREKKKLRRLELSAREKKKLRRVVSNEIKRVDAAFDQHIKINNCRSDIMSCRDRAAYQERLATLRWVYRDVLDGSKFEHESSTIITDLPDERRKRGTKEKAKGLARKARS